MNIYEGHFNVFLENIFIKYLLEMFILLNSKNNDL